MIPLPLIPWRLIGAVAGVAAVAFAGYRVNTWHTAYGELRATQARLELEEACGEGSSCRARVDAAEAAGAAKQRETDAEVLSGYQTGLETVAAYAAAHPAPSVRLCKPANRTAVRVPGTPEALMVAPTQETYRKRLERILESSFSTSPTKPTGKP